MRFSDRAEEDKTYKQEDAGFYEGASQAEGGSISLCSFLCGDQEFGIDTKKIREVIRVTTVQRVPLTPSYIGGVVPYRGEMLTTVSFTALLDQVRPKAEGWVLVLDGREGEELFGLLVAEGVGGVVTADLRTLVPNPSTLDEESKALFSGAFRMSDRLLVNLDPDRLRPERLGETGLFGHVLQGDQAIRKQGRWERDLDASTHSG